MRHQKKVNIPEFILFVYTECIGLDDTVYVWIAGKKKRKHNQGKLEQKDENNATGGDPQQDGALKAPSNQVVPTKKGTVKLKKIVAEKKPDKLTKALKRTNADDLEDAKPIIIPIEKPLKKPKKGQRPSTVKTYRASFRATGSL